MNKSEIIKTLKSGGIGVMPTDTIYGLVGLALNKKTVERIYKVRRRSPDKPLIILISSLADLELFGVELSVSDKKTLQKIWPGQVSIILSCPQKEFRYLHRGTKTLAFRLPAKKSVLEILKQTGPLVAPSANPEGSTPVSNLKIAQYYFGDRIDFYYGRGELKAPASTLIRLASGKIEILRQGAVKI